MSSTNPAATGAPFSEYARKSVVALVIGLITALASSLGILLASLSAESDGGSSITGAEWVKFTIALLVAVAGALASAYGVYQAMNAPQPARYLNDRS